jgi:hypothetical protein
LQNELQIVVDNALNLRQFVTSVSTIPGNCHWLEPKFRFSIAIPHMDVRRLSQIEHDKVQSISLMSQNDRHNFGSLPRSILASPELVRLFQRSIGIFRPQHRLHDRMITRVMYAAKV